MFVIPPKSVFDFRNISKNRSFLLLNIRIDLLCVVYLQKHIRYFEFFGCPMVVISDCPIVVHLFSDCLVMAVILPKHICLGCLMLVVGSTSKNTFSGCLVLVVRILTKNTYFPVFLMVIESPLGVHLHVPGAAKPMNTSFSASN